ncbi:phage holin family protein [Mucilaginibacter sp. L196]|uniref:phage holin family protein n=1 Tax=Mucilaginibacter sp. L196 TaxID=1641870 RepID=UPI00131C8CE6|nr:phage holin family protein [Mucilaginibacter sp. L196]
MEANNKETPPPIIDQLTEYAELRFKLAKLRAIEGGTSIAASIIADAAVMVCMVLAFIFASLTLAFFLAAVFNSDWEGFGCVALIYLLIALIVKVNKKRLEKPIVNGFINKIFK